VIVYAPHVREVSHVHGRLIEEIGYHCRDYFVSQWDRYSGYPGGVLAHSTHVKGLGSFDTASGTESSRIQVTLATGIARERCERINLGHLDPAEVHVSDCPEVEVVPSWSPRGRALVPRWATTGVPDSTV
jgi:hypothetical protein